MAAAAGPELRAEHLAIGDELLSGARVNSNSAWLGEQLGAAGVPMVSGSVVGDEVDEIVGAIRSAAERVDLVVVTGGLGPTQDDRTRDAVARLLGVGLERHLPTQRRLESWYEARGRTPNPATLTQADLPVGVETLHNGVGAAPGLRFAVGAAEVVCLPGVPIEMTAIMTGSVLPELVARAAAPVTVASFRVVLVPESTVAETIVDVERRAVRAGIKVAYLPSGAELVVRFVGVGAGDQVEALAAEAATLVGDAVTGEGTESLAEAVLRAATRAGATVAVAESLTGGQVTSTLVDAPGASAVVRGGVVSYATEVKADALGVDHGLLDRVGPVDPEVAVQMAQGVRARLGADYGVATTGVAGPEPQDGHSPGTVHVALVGPGGPVVLSPRLRGDRVRVRSTTVVHALELLRRSLLDLPPQRA